VPGDRGGARPRHGFEVVVTVRKAASGSGWRADLKYRGHRASRVFVRRADAQRWLTEQRAEVDRGTWLDPARARTTVAELFEPWLATRDVQGSSRRNDRAVFQAYVLPRFGAAAVGSVSAPVVREWVAGLQTKRGTAAPRTKRDALRILRAVLDYAVEDGRIARNPALGIRVTGTKGSPGPAEVPD